MKIPRYLVIRLDVHGAAVTATDITDRCEVYEYEEAEQTEPNGSEKPNNCTNCECTDDCSECKEAEHGCKDEPQIKCDTCRFEDYSSSKEPCNSCLVSGSNWQPKDEPQTERPWGMYIDDHPMYE